VEKFIGDAVMALFGAPVAHEDDPDRAVRAALAIRDWAREQGDELQLRIAVNTGEAPVTLRARPSEGEAMVAGDVVNTAARLLTITRRRSSWPRPPEFRRALWSSPRSGRCAKQATGLRLSPRPEPQSASTMRRSCSGPRAIPNAPRRR
jgi:Adenylate and Guanylate cyclase catalytic domain